MKDFRSFALPEPLYVSLERMKFQVPTPIQAQAIPLALTGRDILGTAETGTGKTAAFAIPLLANLMANPKHTALVLTPTRELALQVLNVVRDLLGYQSGIKTALLIGGESIQRQFQQLRMRPRVIVGTPGRINDHLARRTLKLQDSHFLVLDETDRMLDMGFGIQIDQIIQYLPTSRQTLMFSATLPRQILKVAEKLLQNPERVSVGSTNVPVQKIKQALIRTTEAAKYGDLVKQLEQRTGTIIIFVKTKFGAERLANKLYQENHRAEAMHGDLQQRKRERLILGFREKRYRIMVATDVAARGLDIPHIEHVINYDLPQCPEDYIHRIGRTGRIGANGQAVSFISPQDQSKWRAIDRLINPDAPRSPEANRGPKRSFKSGRGKSFGFFGKPRRSQDGKSTHAAKSF